MAEKTFYSLEACLAEALLHLAEMRFGWNFLAVSADEAEVKVPP